MTLFQAMVMGLVQGITEYLPVSSSAHLVLVPKMLGWDFGVKEAFVFDVLVQLGTLCGVVFYFFDDLRLITINFVKGVFSGHPLVDESSRTGIFLIIATIPAALIGFLFKDFFEAFFSSPKFSCVFLLVTALLLTFAEVLRRGVRIKITFFDAIIMGCAQALAIFPGLSRSGATISLGMIGGLNRASAARFSFLMSIPVMLGAAILVISDLVKDYAVLSHMIAPLAVGFITAAVSGYIVIKWFLDFLKNRTLLIFAVYCAIIGVAGLL